MLASGTPSPRDRTFEVLRLLVSSRSWGLMVCTLADASGDLWAFSAALVTDLAGVNIVMLL